MKDDRELVAEALEGGLEAFGEIVDRYRDAVFGVSLARLRNFHDAEDVAQTVFVEAFGKLDNFKEPMNLGAWLRTIAIRRSIDLIRTKKESVGIDGIEREEAEANGSDLREQVLEAIGKLGKAQRETVSLYYINGYTIDEVATMQGSPAGTVKRRLHEARKKLKEEMMKTVEGVLKSEAPKEDFGEEVFGRLNSYGRRYQWHQALAAVKDAGDAGLPGFARALSSRHWQTRRCAGQMLGHVESNSEELIKLLKSVLGDTNKKVRKHALWLLMLDVSEERKRDEFLPLLIPMLTDRSANVRKWAAWRLHPWASDVPLATVVEAGMSEKNAKTRTALQNLTEAVVASQKKDN